MCLYIRSSSVDVPVHRKWVVFLNKHAEKWLPTYMNTGRYRTTKVDAGVIASAFCPVVQLLVVPPPSPGFFWIINKGQRETATKIKKENNYELKAVAS